MRTFPMVMKLGKRKLPELLTGKTLTCRYCGAQIKILRNSDLTVFPDDEMYYPGGGRTIEMFTAEIKCIYCGATNRERVPVVRNIESPNFSVPTPEDSIQADVERMEFEGGPPRESTHDDGGEA